MKISKWIALIVTVCLLTGIAPASLAEEQEIAADAVEAGVAPAESIGGGTGLSVEPEDGSPIGEPLDPSGVDAEIQQPSQAPDGEYRVDAPAPRLDYARAKQAGARLYADALTGDVFARLAAGEVVLVTGSGEGMATVAVNAEGGLIEGYMDSSDLEPLDAGEVEAYVRKAAASGRVILYENDIELPLAALGSVTEGNTSVMAANYTQYDNDTVFTVNGRQISASMVGSKGSGNCWAWAQEIYKLIWDCRFSENFEGKSATGMNLLRELNDSERKLTPEHLKTFVQNAKPGATIRVCGCTSDCPQFQNDGLRCGHTGHSLIIIEKRSDGLVTLDDHSNTQHTRFYSWQGFCNSWKNFPYIKYIKWPGAPALSPVETIDGCSVRACEETYRVRQTSEGAGVYSAPTGGNLLLTLKYPATFAAAKRSTGEIEGSAWVYGSAEGVTGWIALNDSVANVDEVIKVTGVTLSQSSLQLKVGGTASLTAAVAPLDATRRDVTWSSSDPSVARVQDGTVSAVAEGEAVITAAAGDGEKTAACAVKVTASLAEKVIRKTGSNGTVNLAPDQRLQLVPSFATSKGWKIKSAKSSNSECASIDREGVVTARAEGTATITITTRNGRKATLKIKVVDIYKPAKIYLSKKGTVKLRKGATLKLYAAVKPVTAVTSLTWGSSRPKIASVDDEGKVVALKKGTCYIGVKTENGKIAKVKIRVY